MKIIDNIPVWGPAEEGALSQIKTAKMPTGKRINLTFRRMVTESVLQTVRSLS